MARIAGINIPLKKRIEIGLTYIYGIGRSTSARILKQSGISPDTYVKDLTDEEIVKLREAIDSGLGVEGDLCRERSQSVKRLTEIGCEHGVGIVDHIEDRVVGLKVRDIYEVPAAAIVLTAHKELEKLVVDLETGQRGYVVTHDERFLEPWQTARAAIRPTAERLERRLPEDVVDGRGEHVELADEHRRRRNAGQG
jgi:small subunit ribosomal protein S13